MKHLFILATVALSLAACANEDLINNNISGGQTSENSAISFVMEQQNMGRSTQNLQDTKHYNFGVFAYKSTETVNNIMANYLVGYSDETNKLGYKFGAAQTTQGDEKGQVDGKSMWQYEGLGNTEYTYAGDESFYKASETAFMSNEEKQYLRYFDKAAATTVFYAYAPYMNGANTVTYVDGTAQSATGSDTYVMCFPDGSITDGYDNASLLEYMYAATKVAKADYGHDVSLNFTRLNAKVNIKFWEDIPGYSVRILDLGKGKNNQQFSGVQAAASIKEDGAGSYGYKAGKYYSANGAKIKFGAGNGTVTGIKQFKGTEATNTRPIIFAAPADAKIGETRLEATKSETTYYAIPKGETDKKVLGSSDDYSATGTAEDADFGKTGFTFHVTYELTSTSGERIVVKNATVHVPADYCNWKPNTHYTYIFKITKGSNGSTDPEKDSTIDPTDPEVPTEGALYPIVFDNCTISDYDTEDTEWVITDDTNLAYYDVQLSTYSVTNTGSITVTIDQIDDYAGASNAPDYTNVTVTKADGSDDANVTYDASTKKITVAAGAAGKYIVTYTCADADIDMNHPHTWTETFWVGNEYTLATNLNEVGTGGLADTKLAITATKDGATVTPAATNLYIEYPKNATDDKVKVVGSNIEAATDATPGKYKLVYRIDEGNGVKVAEKEFEVKNYQFALDNEVVYLNGNQTVTANKIADADHVYTVAKGTGTSDLTINSTNKNQVDVPATTAEGTYTVTYTLYGTGDNAVSKVQYQKAFEVRNIHAVALSATSMDRSTGTSTSGAYSTDTKTITTLQNGSATTEDLTAKLSIVKANGDATTAGDFNITYTSGNSYTLEVKNTVPAANYRVKFVSTVKGEDAAEYFDFVVTD